MSANACVISSCEAISYYGKLGMCSVHHRELVRWPACYGDVDAWLSNLAGPNGDACVETPFPLCVAGYPHVKHVALYRVLAFRKYGRTPKGFQISHTCDNNWCGNDLHLEFATAKANKAVSVKNGSSARGDRVHTATMTAQQVECIITRYPQTKSERAPFVNAFGVRDKAVRDIASGYTWKHLARWYAQP